MNLVWRCEPLKLPVCILKAQLPSHQIYAIFAPKQVCRMTQLAKYVKAMRKQFGLTQIDLSRKSGLGMRFVHGLEQGKTTLCLDKVNQVLAMFGAEMTPAKVTEV